MLAAFGNCVHPVRPFNDPRSCPDHRAELVLRSAGHDGDTHLSAAVYEMRHDAQSAESAERQRWLETELDNNTATLQHVCRLHALSTAAAQDRSGVAENLARYLSKFAHCIFQSDARDMRWLRVSLDEAAEFEYSSRTVLNLRGSRVPDDAIDAAAPVGICFECVCPLAAVLESRHRSVSDLPCFTLDDVRGAQMRELVDGDDGSGAQQQRCGIFVPLLIVSGAYYKQFARDSTMGSGYTRKTHALRLTECSTLLLQRSSPMGTLATVDQQQLRKWLTPALVPAARSFYVDVVTLVDVAQDESRQRRFELQSLLACNDTSVGATLPTGAEHETHLERLLLGKGGGERLEANAAAVHILLGALQRFHCERTTLQQVLAQSGNGSVGGADRASTLSDVHEFLHDTIYLPTHRYRHCSLRQLMQQRGFGALARSVACALRGEFALVRRPLSFKEKFHCRWFERTLCQVYAFVLHNEFTAHSEATVRALVRRNPRLSQLIDVREPRDNAERATLAWLCGNDAQLCDVPAHLLFVMSMDTFFYGAEGRGSDDRACGDVRSADVCFSDGAVYCTYRTLGCLKSAAAADDDDTDALSRMQSDLFAPRRRWPWLVHFFAALLRKRSDKPSRKRSIAACDAELDAFARVGYLLRALRSDLPLSGHLYAQRADRRNLLDDWPVGGKRALKAKGSKCDLNNTSFVTYLGMEAGRDNFATRGAADGLWHNERRQLVPLTPLAASATPRATLLEFRDAQLVRQLQLKPEEDRIDALLERRALAPCLVAMEMRARDVRFVDASKGYKHYDRIDHASQLYSLVPEVVPTDEEVVAHIYDSLKHKNASCTEDKVFSAHQDLRAARQHYDRKHTSNTEYLLENAARVTEVEAGERTAGCLSCNQVARAQAQKSTNAHLRCPFADLITKRITRATFAKYLDATCGSSTDIEDLGVAFVSRFSVGSKFQAIADYCEGGASTADVVLPSGEKAAVGGRSAQRACAEFMQCTRAKKTRGAEHLQFRYPRDYTRLALHLEHVSDEARAGGR